MRIIAPPTPIMNNQEHLRATVSLAFFPFALCSELECCWICCAHKQDTVREEMSSVTEVVSLSTHERVTAFILRGKSIAIDWWLWISDTER